MQVYRQLCRKTATFRLCFGDRSRESSATRMHRTKRGGVPGRNRYAAFWLPFPWPWRRGNSLRRKCVLLSRAKPPNVVSRTRPGSLYARIAPHRCAKRGHPDGSRGGKYFYRNIRRQARIYSFRLNYTLLLPTERCPSPRPGPPRAPRRRRVGRPSAKTGVYLRREIALECGLRACPAAGQRPRNPSPRKPCCRVRSQILAKEWPDSSASAAELRPGTEARSLATRRSRESSRSRPVRSIPDLDHG